MGRIIRTEDNTDEFEDWEPEMVENKHTAGPWFCEYGADGYYGLYHSGDLPLDDNIAENERLIAAAPDLLEALQSLCSRHRASLYPAEYEQALAPATGGGE